MGKQNELFASYLAGFLDGDGSIYVRIKPNTDYRFNCQIAPYIVFYQSAREREFLEKIHSRLKIGYIRDRKDGICEYTIGDVKSIRNLLQIVQPYLQLKRKQAELMLKILDYKEKVKNRSEFVRLCRLIDKFSVLNYSKKRTQVTSKIIKIIPKDP